MAGFLFVWRWFFLTHITLKELNWGSWAAVLVSWRFEIRVILPVIFTSVPSMWTLLFKANNSIGEQELGEDQRLCLGTCAGKASANPWSFGKLHGMDMDGPSSIWPLCWFKIEVLCWWWWVCPMLLGWQMLTQTTNGENAAVPTVKVGKSTIISGLKEIGFGTARHCGHRISITLKHKLQSLKKTKCNETCFLKFLLICFFANCVFGCLFC